MAGKTEQKDSMSKAQVTIPLDIPDVRILKTELNKRGNLVIIEESTAIPVLDFDEGNVIFSDILFVNML